MNRQVSPVSVPAALAPLIPQLLVSVRDAQEAEAAVAGRADWIDLKEPSAGPLAAVDVQAAREVAKVLAGRRTLSAALGELCNWEQSSAQGLLAVEGISVVKLGLAGCAQRVGWQQQWLEVAATAKQAQKQLVAVVYADFVLAASPSPLEIIALAQQAESQYLLVDTYNKKSGTLLDHLSCDELANLIATARQAHLRIVLAGSLSRELLTQLPAVGIDIIAVRGAVCRSNRTGQIETELVVQLQEALASRFALRQQAPAVERLN